MKINATARAERRSSEVEALLGDSSIRVFIPSGAGQGGLFRKVCGVSKLVGKIERDRIEQLALKGSLHLIASTNKGRHYKPASPGERRDSPRTARDHRNAAWLAAERVFARPEGGKETIKVNLGESPLGWLSRRRDAQGRPFLGKAEVAAGERLRADFERSQLAPSVTFDWRRLLTSTIDGGARSSSQEREVDGGATAARKRLHAALDALGPGLADVALRACCFLEGLETVEASMNWSARSGKIVLRIALQRLSAFYESNSTRKSAEIGVWQSTDS